MHVHGGSHWQANCQWHPGAVKLCDRSPNRLIPAVVPFIDMDRLVRYTLGSVEVGLVPAYCTTRPNEHL